MGFKTDDVFGDARFVEQRLDIGQLLRRRGQQARRQRAKPLPQQLLFNVGEHIFLQAFRKQQQPGTVPFRGTGAINFMLRAPGQAQPFITQAIEAAPADADNIKPLFFIEAKQRGAYEALAEA